MPTRIIRDEKHIAALGAILARLNLPITVSWVQGAPRTDAQNRLAFRWYQDAARQLGDRSHEDARAESKVGFAAPILCAGNDAFRLSWERLRERFTHEEIVQFVRETQLPMTSLMLMPQMREYMDAIERHWRGLGVRLTDPEALKYESEFE
jgi:TPR repeat protein